MKEYKQKHGEHILTKKNLLNKKINLAETFLAICGEGTEIGEKSVFIRVAGCNMRCEYPCDTRYAYKTKFTLTPAELYDKIQKYNFKKVFWTGGEVTLQEKGLDGLMCRLKREGYYQIIQTNGSKYSEIFQHMNLISVDFKGPSAGKNNKSSEKVIRKIVESFGYFIPIQIKFLVKNDEDYNFTKRKIEWLSKLDGSTQIKIIVGPVGGINNKNLINKVLRDDFWKNHLNVKFLIQMHKLIYGQRRGV